MEYLKNVYFDSAQHKPLDIRNEYMLKRTIKVLVINRGGWFELRVYQC